MEIIFGKFGEEDEEPPIKAEELKTIKNFLESTLNTLKLKGYKSVYVANPHQCFSEDFEPKQSEKDILELYFYSMPVGANASLGRIENITQNGGQILLREGQKDSIKIEVVPSGCKIIEDDEGKQIALVQENKVWILNDLLHNVGTFTDAQQAVREALRFIADMYFNPPTEVELRQRAAEKIASLIKENFNRHKKSLEERVKSLSSELQQREAQIAQNIRSLAYESELLELANKRIMPKADVIMYNIDKMPFIKKVSFKGGQLTVDTNPISIGPFEYGSWNIVLALDNPVFKHEATGVRHPYEYEDHRFCMGGFAGNYVLATNSGEYDKALAICRLEITNYSTETRMKSIEDFLKKIMGAVVFNKILRVVKEENFPDAEGVIISKINGSTVTYVATMKATDGHEVPTVKSVEINYAK